MPVILWPHPNDELLVELRRVAKLLGKYERDIKTGHPFEQHLAKRAARLRGRVLRFAVQVAPSE